MDRSHVINLIAVTHTVDNIGQRVANEVSRTVYCDLRNVSRQEWKDAGERGFKPQFQITLFAYDYNGEEIAEINGKRYGVYRTYHGRDDSLELYLEEKAGL